MPIRIVLIDDHGIVREGIRALLETEPDLHVVGEAAEGLGAADLIEKLTPDVVFLDLMMPGLGGLGVLGEVRRRGLPSRVVILSMHDSEAYILEALRQGAAGYVLKESGGAVLVEAAREVAAGRRYLCPSISVEALEDYASRTQANTLDLYETLTARERDVLNHAAEGLTNAEIGARLFISPRTVEIHRARFMQKLGLRSQADLFRFALKRGLIAPELPIS